MLTSAADKVFIRQLCSISKVHDQLCLTQEVLTLSKIDITEVGKREIYVKLKIFVGLPNMINILQHERIYLENHFT